MKSCLIFFNTFGFLFQLLKVPRLEMVETIDSIKLANELNKRWSSILPNDPLKVLVQVNTSGEEGVYLI